MDSISETTEQLSRCTIVLERPDGSLPTLGREIAARVRYIRKTGKHWAGTPSEFNSWALRNIRDYLAHIASDDLLTSWLAIEFPPVVDTQSNVA